MSYTASLVNVRVAYVALACGTITLGLTLHLHGNFLGPTARDVLGDVIWAAMIAWWVGAIVPGSSLRARSVAAVAICFAVEVSQLYHTPALDTLRRTTVGQLTLGTGFDLRDLLAYIGGVLAAAFLERAGRLWFVRRQINWLRIVAKYPSRPETRLFRFASWFKYFSKMGFMRPKL
jgi:hypothetical protein